MIETIFAVIAGGGILYTIIWIYGMYCKFVDYIVDRYL